MCVSVCLADIAVVQPTAGRKRHVHDRARRSATFLQRLFQRAVFKWASLSIIDGEVEKRPVIGDKREKLAMLDV